jgi:CRP/FNR family transcriptional regulator
MAERSPERGWLDAFKPLAGLEPEARRLLASTATVITMPAGAMTFSPGQQCQAYVLVIAGSVKVHMLSETGREIVLYRIEGGETCILTTACLLAGMEYAAEAIAETDVRVALLPRAAFTELMATSAVFRDFVFHAFGQRIADLLLVVEEVAFRRLDVRLARLLLDRRDAVGAVHLSHQELAVELGSAREVVSRQLKDFERRGWVTLNRGRIDVASAPALHALIARNA